MNRKMVMGLVSLDVCDLDVWQGQTRDDPLMQAYANILAKAIALKTKIVDRSNAMTPEAWKRLLHEELLSEGENYEIYKYVLLHNNEARYGFRIFDSEDKNVIVYEASGIANESSARGRWLEVAKDFINSEEQSVERGKNA